MEDSGDGRYEFRVPVRLSPEEYSTLAIESILRGVPVGELLRERYFDGTRDPASES